MTTLEGQTLVIVGGSSGLGFAVAKAALLSLASHVIIASSSPDKVQNAIEKLEQAIGGKGLTGKISGATLNVRDLEAVKTYFANIGEIDHLIWTSGDPLKLGFPDVDITAIKGATIAIIFFSYLVNSHLIRIKTHLTFASGVHSWLLNKSRLKREAPSL